MTGSARGPKTMNTEIERGVAQRATLLTPNAHCRAKLMIIFAAMRVPGHFRAECSHPAHQLAQPVLQAANSAKSPETMNTEIQRGVGQRETPLTPNPPFQGGVDHFCGQVCASTFFERSAIIRCTSWVGQLVLQAAGSAMSPKTMNTEVERGLEQSSPPLTPNAPLQEVDDHF